MKLPCGDCHLCCTLPLLVVDVHHTEAPALEIRYTDGNPIIKKRKNGSCVYLTKRGCKIYDHRPSACSGFTCEKFFNKKWDAQYNQTTMDECILPLRRAANALRSRMKQSLARRFNAQLEVRS